GDLSSLRGQEHPFVLRSFRLNDAESCGVGISSVSVSNQRRRKMHIFIDESGTSSSPGTKSVSAVGALVIPDRRLPYIIRRYLRSRNSLPKDNEEVKGRRLAEHQIVAVLDQLQKADVLFELSFIDMAMNSEADIRN